MSPSTGEDHGSVRPESDDKFGQVVGLGDGQELPVDQAQGGLHFVYAQQSLDHVLAEVDGGPPGPGDHVELHRGERGAAVVEFG
jgi:hypothetical protein